MVLSTDGLVLTNNHVINGAKMMQGDARRPPAGPFSATVVGYDTNPRCGAAQAQWRRRAEGRRGRQLRAGHAGHPVLALGNAEGQGGLPTLAQGTINSLDKTISPTDESTGATETLRGVLQTNANVVSGDSGGPLANAAGQVIGMDTANASSSQGSSSVLGYAIPIDTALSVADQIAAGRASATVQIGLPGFLGVLVPEEQQHQPGAAGEPATAADTAAARAIGRRPARYRRRVR